MRSTQKKSFPVRAVRHAAAFLFLWIAWRYLSEWYVYHGRTDYFLFSLFFLAALWIAAWSVGSLLKQAGTGRVFIVLFLLSLILPWGEWLQRNFPNAREDWSRQIFKQAVLLYILILILSFKPQALHRLAERVRASIDHLAKNKFLLWLPCLLFFLGASSVAIFVFQKTSFIPDSASYLFQAKTFTGREWAAPAPPVPDFFRHSASCVAMNHGRWYSAFSPGFPALLAVAMSFGLEWFVAPLLGALTCGIWIAYAKRWHNQATAFLLGWMILFSPFLLLISATITAHTPELFLMSAATFLCRLEMETPRLRNRLALILVLCFGILTRSFSFLAFLTPVLAYASWSRFRKHSVSLAVAIFCGIGLGIVLSCIYNWKTVGNPWTPPYAHAGGGYGLGNVYVGQIHTPVRGLENTSNQLLSLNTWLSGWSTGSLFFILLFLLCAGQFVGWDRVLLLGCGTLASFYFFYYYQDLVIGPRFFYICAPILLLMIANLPFVEIKTQFDPVRNVATILIFALLVYSVPFSYPKFIQRLNPFYDQSGFLKKKLEELGGRKALIFLDNTMRGEFVGWNDPFLKSPTIFCLDLGNQNSKAMEAFPDYQPVYFGLKMIGSGMQTQEEYLFYDQRSSDEIPGNISLFRFAMVLQGTGKDTDEDAFDICYGNFLTLEPAKDSLNFLNSKMDSGPAESYRTKFQRGLVHAGKLVLLPKNAWEKSNREWFSQLDEKEFSEELHSALRSFRESGDSGQPLVESLEKVARRIDQNRDGAFSKSELKKFLYPKIQLLEFRTYF